MDDCLFCKIIAGEVPSDKIYEDDDVFTFLDIAPNNSGHTLVVPKKHFTNIFDTPDETLKHMISVIKKLSIAIKETLKVDGVNIHMNNEKGAGQAVFHAHIHIIPRFKGDGHQLWHGNPKLAKKNKEIGEKIKNAL